MATGKLTCCWAVVLIFGCHQVAPIVGSSVVVGEHNIDEIVESNELVLLNFYTDWCPFSIRLAPIFEEAARQIAVTFTESGLVTIGKVNCDTESNLAERFDIIKYPTLKVVRHGLIGKSEYRGQRSVQALYQFVVQELADPVKEFQTLEELHNAKEDTGLLVGYFMEKNDTEYKNYRKVASILKKECQFLVGFGELTETLHPAGKNLIIFRADATKSSHREYYSEYSGNMSSFDDLLTWTDDKCIQLVREITFSNAEEIGEEGLPFVMLFYDKDNMQPVQEFKTVVETKLSPSSFVNYLTADGELFAHPLQHLGKTKDDLPIIAIDSFRHMYLFPRYEDIHKPGALQGFIDDLYTGKLHHHFHYGENVTTSVWENDSMVESNNIVAAVVPDSQFKQLLPSPHRYTLINRTKDEL
ncbi:endoplasmic reticulum resident protein 44 [Drosophila guanche]|uniref:Blast:Endoplasmic reticulum resident protein 44 n=1 Tax=Drosophila guanche TaxID=7266 RepID=A0A3B0JPH0_DROGU|nr:endoplasmic reticulum resident protein 44 [Drosophila guanche]SPP84117.1 blast:Endoplasmic reticulum resident protein 44 [Drosophila guanche]